MKVKFRNNILPTIRNNYERFEVWYLMENYNVWRKHTECLSFDMALKESERLEKQCKCFTEIKHIQEDVTIIRRYAYE